MNASHNVTVRAVMTAAILLTVVPDMIYSIPIESRVSSDSHFVHGAEPKLPVDRAVTVLEQMGVAINKVLSKPKMKLRDAHKLLHEAGKNLFVTYYRDTAVYKGMSDELILRYISIFHDAKNEGMMADSIVEYKLRYHAGNSLLSKETRGELRFILRNLKKYTNELKSLKQSTEDSSL